SSAWLLTLAGRNRLLHRWDILEVGNRSSELPELSLFVALINVTGHSRLRASVIEGEKTLIVE
ncbi:MAG: hypothetical protein ACRC11_10365, partial [Xenococcaceae cyanobacterium]